MANEGKRAGYAAKKAREYFERKWTEQDAEYESLQDVVYQILKQKGECMKLEDICEELFKKEGEQYNNDSMRDAVWEVLQNLCNQGKAEHPEHGYYQAKRAEA